jgi:hypothetical protein
MPSPFAPAPGPFLSAVIPVYSEDSGVYAKIYVPLFSLAADMLADRRRRWVWHPRYGSARDMAVSAEDQELLANCFRYACDLLHGDYPFVAAGTTDIIFAIDFRPQLPPLAPLALPI